MPADHEGAIEAAGRMLCAIRCGAMGEPACWDVVPDEWPAPSCIESDGGCLATARAAIAAYEAERDETTVRVPREHLAELEATVASLSNDLDDAVEMENRRSD